ncbi:MAG: DUF4352 domain-containing protein [Lachnospiraceae bacterium]|nr:DUF4352 domain-containing protein [Lachnospiraceae bacterium]
MKKFIKRGTALLAAALILTGCGDEMATLTESEEEVIVNYSAGTLAKHNSYQQEGMSSVYPKEEEESFDSEETEEKEPENQEESKENKESEGSQEKPAEEEAKTVTLTEALAIPGIEFAYQDYSTSDSYRQGDYFSLDALEGSTYVILNVNVTNTGAEAAECDLLSRQPVFHLKINGESGVKNVISMLENDLSTYISTLEAGQTAAGILMFEVPKELAENISSLELSLEMNGNTSEIKL